MARRGNGNELGDSFNETQQEYGDPIGHGLFRRENGAKDKKEKGDNVEMLKR
jgi:hypothetical protein